MKRITIDYGIDLGTTNSTICRMEYGEPKIIRTDSGMDTMPSCVSFKKNGAIRIGQSAYDDLGSDRIRALKKRSALASTSCIEFKRYMGSDKTFSNIYAEHQWSPEELSAQVLKTLCSFVSDDQVKAAVVTVPAKFTVNQKDATLEAARLAGISQVELLQEPIAASFAYGLKAENKNGIWMVFDFGGGTLDVALVHVRDGVMQVFDTEGDNYLGGKNIDEAIVTKIILPQIAQRYVLDLSDEVLRGLYIDALKVEAEKSKIRLTYSETDTIYLEAGDWGEDEDGEEIDLEITITRQELENAIRPILQKSVDVCKTLMQRNNISYGKLSHLIPIGGPTCIPLLRKMLQEQVSENIETSVNPMTAVAKGAAIYASTIPVKINEDEIEDDVLQLSVDFDSTTVDTMMFVPVKAKKCTPGLSVKMIRRADGKESPTVMIPDQGGLVEMELLPDQPNLFRIIAYVNDVEVRCFPYELTIVQGTKAGNAILPYNIGMEVYNPRKNVCVFTAFTGLEKNRSLPAVGTVYGLKTMSELRPGNEDDVVRIAVYQGDENAEGKTAALFEYVADVTVSGGDIVSYIPEGSLINILVEVDRSEMMKIVATFPESSQTVEKKLDTSRRQETVDIDYLNTKVMLAFGRLRTLREQIGNTDEIAGLDFRLNQVKEAMDAGAQRKQIEQHIKEISRDIEEYETATEWDREYIKLQNVMTSLQAAAASKTDPRVSTMVDSYIARAERTIAKKDVLEARTLQAEMDDYKYELNKEVTYRNYIRMVDTHFMEFNWKNPELAQRLIIQAKGILAEDPDAPLAKTQTIVELIHGQRIFDKDSTSVNAVRIDIPSM